MLLWNYSDYSGEVATATLPLLLSERSQSLALAAISEMLYRHNWIDGFNDTAWDDIDEIVSNAISELQLEVQPTMTTPVGSIMAYVDWDAPDGWLKCEGQQLSQATYPELYAVCGTRFGSDAGGMFYIPDLRARMVFGATTDSGIGAVTGNTVHTLTIDEMPAHTHEILKASSVASQVARAAIGSNATVANQQTTSVGGGEPFSIMNPNMMLTWIIKHDEL